jgi:hypothetical protein
MAVGEILGAGKDFISQVMQLDVVTIFAILFVLIIIAYKVFTYLMKALITGMAFGFIPIAANYLGYGMEISLPVILQFVLFGIAVFVAYSVIKTILRALGFVLSPFRGAFKKPPRAGKVAAK